jgi:hypothetical protein
MLRGCRFTRHKAPRIAAFVLQDERYWTFNDPSAMIVSTLHSVPCWCGLHFGQHATAAGALTPVVDSSAR